MNCTPARCGFQHPEIVLSTCASQAKSLCSALPVTGSATAYEIVCITTGLSRGVREPAVLAVRARAARRRALSCSYEAPGNGPLSKHLCVLNRQGGLEVLGSLLPGALPDGSSGGGAPGQLHAPGFEQLLEPPLRNLPHRAGPRGPAFGDHQSPFSVLLALSA